MRVPEQLPIFPLGTVLYPGLVLPLHVFEQRYRQMVRDLLAAPADQRRFGVVATRHGRDVGDEAVAAGALHEVGCVAELRDVEQLDDGRFALVTTGTTRFRLGKVDRSRRYLQAEVELLTESPGSGCEPLAAAVAAAFTTYRAGITATSTDLGIVDDPELLSYVVAAATILDLPDKQALLEAPDTTTRLRQELTLLRRETALLSRLPSLPAVELASQETCRN